MNRNSIYKIVLLTIAIISLSAPLQFNRIPGSADADLFAQTAPDTPPQSGQRRDNAGEPEPDQDIPRGRTAISISTELVTLQVLVTDTKGNVVTGLGPKNFTLYEDKVKQEISHFSPIDANITAVLLIEYRKYGHYQIDEMFIDQILSITDTFVRDMRRGDWVGVIGYDLHPIILSDFTQDPQKILESMRAINFPAMSEANLFDALIDTLDRTQENEGKVGIILLSSGENTFSSHTYEEALKKCQQATASIYAISLGQYYRVLAGAGGQFSNLENIDLAMMDNHLRYFAEYTGGAAYYPRFDSEFSTIIRNISTLMRSQYSIGYVSSNTKKDGKFRKISVEVNTDLKRDGKPLKLKVQTRKGYLPSKN